MAKSGSVLSQRVQPEVRYHVGDIQWRCRSDGERSAWSAGILDGGPCTGSGQLPVYWRDGQSGSALFADPICSSLVLPRKSSTWNNGVRNELDGSPVERHARSAGELCGADGYQLHNQLRHKLYDTARSSAARELQRGKEVTASVHQMGVAVFFCVYSTCSR